MNHPLISIIIPTFNRSQLLGETLDSVIAQTYLNWECLVVDDGSMDTTLELMEFYCTKDHRITYWARPLNISKGAASSRNYGFLKSRGEYVMWLDDDDIICKDKLKNQIKIGYKNSTAVITCGWGRFYSLDNFNLKNLEIYRNYDRSIDLLADYGKFDCFFPCHVFLVPRKNIEKAGLWRTDLAINDDGEFFARIINASSAVLFAEKTHVKYRYHLENRMSMVNSVDKGEDLIRSWQLIKNNFNRQDQKKIHIYLSNGIKHSYTLLKSNGYKRIIFRYFWIFKTLIFKDGIKKMISQ